MAKTINARSPTHRCGSGLLLQTTESIFTRNFLHPITSGGLWFSPYLPPEETKFPETGLTGQEIRLRALSVDAH